ncbi:MAG: hypothetical protein CM15mV4_1210 [Caudoviricetes sp.]|nr:MAG: hypothetical protein CM15mV4_1210 [Caudoviricetes sp.]
MMVLQEHHHKMEQSELIEVRHLIQVYVGMKLLISGSGQTMELLTIT